MEIPSLSNLLNGATSAQQLGHKQLQNKQAGLEALADQFASENKSISAESASADSTSADSASDSTSADPAGKASPELKEAFESFVGQTFFSEMIKAARTAQQKPAYFHGGRAEEVFQSQFDQMLSERMSEVSADKVAEPMLELFMLGLNNPRS